MISGICEIARADYNVISVRSGYASTSIFTSENFLLFYPRISSFPGTIRFQSMEEVDWLLHSNDEYDSDDFLVT